MLTARTCVALQVRTLAARVITGARPYSKDYASSSDDEKDTKPRKSKPAKADKKVVESSLPADNSEESAANRLNRLLASMQTDDKKTYSSSQISMAKPGEGKKRLKEMAMQSHAKTDVFEAAKRVASMLGDENKKQTESELLSKLLGHAPEGADAAAAETDADAKAADVNELSLSELIVGMKIDRREQPKEPNTRADFVRRALNTKMQQHQTPYNGQHKGGNFKKRPSSGDNKRSAETYTGSVNLFGSEPLNIFKATAAPQQSAELLPTWAQLQQRALKLQITHPPANHFEKMALWTEQGKLWKFPIDNEQHLAIDMAETDVDFSEHIFLDQHLEAWCPSKGPIRHFMELVCVGLSKNPYITAQEKREHIQWYREYFESKKDILRDLMSEEKMAKIGSAAQATQ